jgi:hypothetical protein
MLIIVSDSRSYITIYYFSFGEIKFMKPPVLLQIGKKVRVVYRI